MFAKEKVNKLPICRILDSKAYRNNINGKILFLISELVGENPTAMKLIFKHDRERERFSVVRRTMRRLRYVPNREEKRRYPQRSII